MIQIDITPNRSQLARLEKDLAGIKNGLPKAITRAVNKTATNARRQLVTQLASAAGEYQKNIRSNIELIRATWKTLTARIRLWRLFTADRVMDRNPRKTSTGIQYQLKVKNKFAGWVQIPGAFFATMPTGLHSVFKRRGRKRLPIDEQRTESWLEAARRIGLLDRIRVDSRQRLMMEMDRQAKLLLDRRKAT
jgi:hypothetical protein